MGTEFERLMRLAEKNTLAIQRSSSEKKRAVGSLASDTANDRELREKRRRLELEQRVQQREEDERQRLMRSKASLERKRQARLEAEKTEQLRQKRAQQQKTEQQQQQKQKVSNGRQQMSRSSSAPKTLSFGAAGAFSAAESKRTTTSAQPISYDELMRIASGKAKAPLPPANRSMGSRTLPARKSEKAPASGISGPRHHRMQPEVKRPQSASDLPWKLPEGAASRPRQQALVGNTRRAVPLIPSSSPARSNGTRAPSRNKSTSVTSQQERVARRLPPEREIDRFGVLPKPGATKGGRALHSSSRTLGTGRSSSNNDIQTTALERLRNIRDSSRPDRSAASSRVSATTSRLDPRNRLSVSNVISVPSELAARTNRRCSPPPRSHQQPPIPRGRAKHDHASRHGNNYDNYESEYDSLDDFIVDDEDDTSGAYRVGSIREMLGVRYHDVDDGDDDDMEVSAQQLMREEKRSARIGRMEDEEEERRLAEEERERERRRRVRERQRE
ncbi:SPT2 chromatin protein-domain-containing protein [Coemansia spiralis]|nr:SPT2 chromatin protein-domain-containing protein [Coemansia spiralis]